MTDVTLYTQALDSDGDTNNGYTNAIVWGTAALTMPGGSILTCRVTFEAGAAQALTITNAYIGHAAASGDVYDFLATPVQLLFAGSGTKAISAGATAVSDYATFAYNKTSNLIVAYYTNGGTSFDMVRYKTGLSNVNSYNKAAVSEAATVDKTGYTNIGGGGWMYGINKVEAQTADGGAWVMFF